MKRNEREHIDRQILFQIASPKGVAHVVHECLSKNKNKLNRLRRVFHEEEAGNEVGCEEEEGKAAVGASLKALAARSGAIVVCSFVVSPFTATLRHPPQVLLAQTSPRRSRATCCSVPSMAMERWMCWASSSRVCWSSFVVACAARTTRRSARPLERVGVASLWVSSSCVSGVGV